MSKSAEERMGVIETEVKNLNRSIEIHVSQQRHDFELVFQKLDDLNGRFAGKWVEKVSIGVLITMMAGIIMFIVTNLGG